MVDDIAAGLYRIPIGPGAINNRALKPKSVTAGTISVSDLESVNAKTGNLTANGTITVNSTGSIAIGKTSYADDSTGGMWVGYSGGTYKLNLGNSTYSVKWDGSALNITGNITATTGTIGGWTIGATDLTSDAGATGMASSGGYRIWVGDATPANAEFRVSSAGALTATSATITGAITATSGTLGSLTVNGQLNVSSTSSGIRGGQTAWGTGTGFYLGNNSGGTPVFSVGDGSHGITWNGTQLSVLGSAVLGDVQVSAGGNIRSGATSYASGTGWILEYNGGTPRFRVGTATSGSNYLAFDGTNVEMRGKMKWGSGGNNYLDSSIMHFESDGSNIIDFSRATYTPNAKMVAGITTGYSNINLYAQGASTGYDARVVVQGGNNSTYPNTAYITAGDGTSVSQGEIRAYWNPATSKMTLDLINLKSGTGNDVNVKLGGAGGSEQFKVLDSGSNQVFGVTSDGDLVRPIANDATALGAYYGRIPIYINGSLTPQYLAVYS
jgi:hypothetical protein